MVTASWTRSLALALLLLAPFGIVSADSSASAYTKDAARSVDPGDGFTMIIATHKRDALLPPLIEHLTTTPPPSLRQIVFIWQNIGTPLPDFLNATALEHYSESGVDVKVRVSRKNSMNERFRPLADWHEHIKTRAVMIMDDDVALRRETLEWGYQQWKEFNDGGDGGPTKGKIVGFAGRDAEHAGGGKWSYIVQPRMTYSMVLSNAAWFKRDWLEKYWEDSQEMKGLRDYVDKVFNCDDLLINYIVSNLTHTSPLLLQPKTPLRTVPTKGLWNRDDEADDSFMGADAAKPSPSTSTSEYSTQTDDAGDDPMKADHFGTRELCLARYFTHFAQYAPSRRAPGDYPLIRSSTSVSQDVVDRARWLSPGEQWEEPVWHISDDSGAEDRERLEREEFEQMIEGMTDDEVREFMEQLEAFEAGEGQEDEDEGDEEHHYEEEGHPWRMVDELR